MKTFTIEQDPATLFHRIVMTTAEGEAGIRIEGQWESWKSPAILLDENKQYIALSRYFDGLTIPTEVVFEIKAVSPIPRRD